MLARSSFQMESPSEQETPVEIRSGKHSFSSSPSRQGHCPRTSCSHLRLVPPLQKAPGMPEQPTTKSFSHARGALHATAPRRVSCHGYGSPKGLQSWWGAAGATIQSRKHSASTARAKKPRSRRGNRYFLN